DAVGVCPQAAEGARGVDVAAVAARAVHLGEADGVAGAVDEGGRDHRRPVRDARVGVGKDVGVRAVVADGPVVGAAVGGRAEAVGGGRVGGGQGGLDDLEVLPPRVAGETQLLVDVVLFDEGQHEGSPGVDVTAVGGVGWGKAAPLAGIGAGGAHRGQDLP